MPVPIICLDDELCHFVKRYRERLSKASVEVLCDQICTSLMAKQTESGLMRCEKFLQRRQRRKQNTRGSAIRLSKTVKTGEGQQRDSRPDDN